MFSKLKLKMYFAFITILVCVSLLAGTTFALFTDVSEEVIVRVHSGKLEIDLLQADGNGSYESVKDGIGDVFGVDEWEPNRTEVVFFKVRNNGNIPLGYIFQLNVLTDDLIGALEFSVWESEFFLPSGETWETISQNAAPTMLKMGTNTLSGQNYVTLDPGEEDCYAVAVHMLPQSTNQYQGKTCLIDLFVYAVQGNAV